MNISKRNYIERILLICGEQNAGKSRLLREMLGDPRLGGATSEMGPFRARALSNERGLAGRFTSPHESGDTVTQFHDKIRAQDFRRLNYFSAVQPRAFKNMPGIVEVCRDLKRALDPERIRVVILAPDQFGNDDSNLTISEVDGLRKLDVEYYRLDARRSRLRAEPGNVRQLADFFDFT